MADHWREIPPDTKGYPGYAELTRSGRTFACVGTGPIIRQALVEKAEKTKESA